MADRSDNSPTWVETNLTSPKQVAENLHKEGNVKLREEKVLEKETQNSEKATSMKVAQIEEFEIMQWENATR